MATNPVKAIREKCLECCCGSATEVSECKIARCPLHAFRFGKNPYRQQRVLSEEQKAMMAHRLAEARKNIDRNVSKNEITGDE